MNASRPTFQLHANGTRTIDVRWVFSNDSSFQRSTKLPRYSSRRPAPSSKFTNTNLFQISSLTSGSEHLPMSTCSKSQAYVSLFNVPSKFHVQPWKGHRN